MSVKTESATIRARIDPDLKEEVETILAEIGLSSSDAIRMYYRQIKLLRGIPFDVKIPAPNPVTLAAMQDAETKTDLLQFDSAVDGLKALGLS